MLSQLLRQIGTAMEPHSQFRLHRDACAVLPPSVFPFIAEHGLVGRSAERFRPHWAGLTSNH